MNINQTAYFAITFCLNPKRPIYFRKQDEHPEISLVSVLAILLPVFDVKSSQGVGCRWFLKPVMIQTYIGVTDTRRSKVLENQCSLLSLHCD